MFQKLKSGGEVKNSWKILKNSKVGRKFTKCLHTSQNAKKPENVANIEKYCKFLKNFQNVAIDENCIQVWFEKPKNCEKVAKMLQKPKKVATNRNMLKIIAKHNIWMDSRDILLYIRNRCVNCQIKNFTFNSISINSKYSKKKKSSIKQRGKRQKL